jgi:hypothetical protein
MPRRLTGIARASDRWRVTIFRTGTGCGFTSAGRTRSEAFARACALAGPFYTGGSTFRGTPQPDILPTLQSLFRAVARNAPHVREDVTREDDMRTCSLRVQRLNREG